MRNFTFLARREPADVVGRLLAALLALAAPAASAQGSFRITGTTPAAHAVSASRTAPFTLRFSQPVDPATIGGISAPSVSYPLNVINTGNSADTYSVTTTPSRPLRAGESVSLTVPASVTCCPGGGPHIPPQVVQFTAAASGTPTARLAVRFQPDQRLPNLADATLADVDNDGDLDALACDNVAGIVHVLLNDAAGLLLPAVQKRRAVPVGTTALACADLDNDGDLDLLGLRPGGSGQAAGVWVCRNDGTGTFGTPAAVGSGWTQPTAMCVGDFDADGDLDLAVADAGASTVVVCTNNSGAFQPAGFTTVPCPGFPADLACTDIDNDGDLDLVAACRDTGEIAILLWQLSQWLPQRVALPAGSRNPTGLCAGDLNGDGKVECVVSCAGSPGGGSTGSPVPSGVIVMTHCPPPNQASWCFYDVKDPSPPRQTNTTYRTALADVDGDGDLDVLCPNGASGVAVCRNNGSGIFTDGDASPYRNGGDKVYCWGEGVARVCPGDLDNDGDMDAIAVCTGSGDVASMFNQEPVRVLSVSPRPNALVGGPVSRVSVTYTTPVDAASFALTPSYLIRKLHKCTSTPSSGATGSSTDPRTVHFGYAATAIPAAGYFRNIVKNNGNAADSRTLPTTAWEFDTRPNPSNGMLAAQGQPFTLPATTAVTCAADCDGDGLTDFVNGTVLANIFRLEASKRIGSGSYAAAVVSPDPTFPAGYTPTLLRCADMNNDGSADAVVVGTNGTDSYCAIYTCDAATQRFTKATGDNISGLVTDLLLADVENDGNLEALMPIPGSGSCARKGIRENGLKLHDTPEAGQVLAFVPGGPGAENVVCSTSRGTRQKFTATPYDAAGEPHFEATPADLPAAPGQNMAVADLDGDGIAEVVVPLPSANAFRVKVIIPNGVATGTVENTIATGPGSGPIRTYACDLDGDGDRDLVALCPGTSTVWVGLNDGRGGFAGSPLALPSAPLEAWPGDCDNDGLADLLVRCADGTCRMLEVGPPAANDLFISTTLTIPTGTYHNVTILDGGDATCAAGSPVTCTGQMTVANGGTLHGPVGFTGAGTLVVAPGATLHIDDAAGFSADGSSGQYRTFLRWTSSSWCSKSCAVVYDGTTPQRTGTGLPPQVFELTVANPAGLTLTGPTAITGRIVVKPGCILRPPVQGAQLRIRASVDSTGLVVNEGTGVIQGNVTVEVWASSHTTPNAYGYRHFGPPTNNATVASLGAPSYVPVCSAAFNTSPTPALVRPFPTAMYYDEARQLTAQNNLGYFDKGWTAPVALTDALPVGRGIASNMPSDRRLTFTGPLNNGDISIPLSRHTGPGTGTATSGAWAGWALVSNPYPSPLDWSLLTAANRPGLDASIYAFANTDQYSGRYLSYVNGLGDLDPVLAMGQGFWVRVSAGQTTGTLTFKNEVRHHGPLYDIKTMRASGTTSAARPTLRLALTPEANPTGLLDNLYLYLQAGATAARDAAFDASKMPNSTGLNLSATASGGESLSIQGLPALGNGNIVVPLALGLPAAGRYTLAVGELTNFAPGTRLVLRDQLLGRSTLLSATTRYAFSSTATTVAGRFFLDLAPAAGALASASQLLAAGVSVYPNPAYGSALLLLPPLPGTDRASINLTDALGRVVRTQTVMLTPTGGQTTLDLAGLAPGMYAVRVQAGAAVVLRRIAVK